MFNSAVLDVFIGLVFVFLVVSLIASAITEAIASALKLRSTTLLSGIKDLLNDPAGTGLANQLYKHALINPRGNGQQDSAGKAANKPAYIDPNSFADALIEMANLVGKAPAAMKSAIASSGFDGQTQQLLNGIVDRTYGDVDRIRAQLAAWFDGAMDRVSGAYKRRSQLICFVIALIVAGVLNLDAIKITEALWVRPMLASAVAAQSYPKPTDALKDLDAMGLPVGWVTASTDPADTSQRSRWLGWTVLLGWLITATASIFGAPFWYDALQTFVRIKGAGPSPAEKRSGSAAAA